MSVRFMMLGVVIFLAAPVAAQQGPASEQDEIVITGYQGGAFKLTSDRLRDAVKAFEKYHERFAPEAVLEWRVLDYDPEDNLELALAERKSDERLPISIGADGRFRLPHERMLRTKHDLVANRGAGRVAIRPEAFSPGGTATDHRVGDSRLICRVMMAYMDNDMSYFVRQAVTAIGGCGSRRVNVMWRTEQPIDTVIVSNWDKAVVISEDRLAYRMPTFDDSLGNEEMVSVRYVDASTD